MNNTGADNNTKPANTPLRPSAAADTSDSCADATMDFSDIAPYDQSQFREKLASLLLEPGFEHAVRYVMPGVDFQEFSRRLRAVQTQRQFQADVMGGFLEDLERRTTGGITASGAENLADGASYTFISNHRDIVLDASFLNLCLLRYNKPLTQVAIGNNLLIYDWISDLVKLNRSFIVKRDVRRLEALAAARKLSAYIHRTITVTGQSVWIAQREGRAKDSNDLTQESLVKMLAIAGQGTVSQRLEQINLLPVAISYEYDPNDYLKVREFLLRRRNPDFKKSQHDDLLSMETGLLGYKGRVHFHFGKCITPALAEAAVADTDTDSTAARNAVIRRACSLVDSSIHSSYCFYPINYYAYDRIENTRRFADKVSDADRDSIRAYMTSRLDKVQLADITADERAFMEQVFLSMYANPVRNFLAATAAGAPL